MSGPSALPFFWSPLARSPVSFGSRAASVFGLVCRRQTNPKKKQSRRHLEPALKRKYCHTSRNRTTKRLSPPLPPPPFTWTRDEATGSCSRSPGLRSAPPRFPPPPEKRRRIWRRLQHDAVLPPRRRIGLRGLILVRSPSVGVAKLAAFCRFATVRAEPRCGRFFSATHRHAFGTQNGFGRGDVFCHPGKRTFVS